MAKQLRWFEYLEEQGVKMAAISGSERYLCFRVAIPNSAEHSSTACMLDTQVFFS